MQTYKPEINKIKVYQREEWDKAKKKKAMIPTYDELNKSSELQTPNESPRKDSKSPKSGSKKSKVKNDKIEENKEEPEEPQSVDPK